MTSYGDPKKLIRSQQAAEILKELKSEQNSKEVADDLDIDHGNANRIIKACQAFELVEKTRRTRAQYYKITEKGIDYLERIEALEQKRKSIEDFLVSN